MSIKLSDLVDVKDRTPLVYERGRTWRDHGPHLYHIAHKEGRRRYEKTLCQIADCGRILGYSDGYYGQELPAEGPNFRLCPKCGSRADFEAALAAYHDDVAKHRQAQEEKEKAAEQAAEQARQAALKAMDELAGKLAQVGVDVELDIETGCLLIYHDRKTFRVVQERESTRPPRRR